MQSANYGPKLRSLKSWAMSTEASPEYAGVGREGPRQRRLDRCRLQCRCALFSLYVQRTLEYVFAENYGVSSIRFLRLQRLNRLRRSLADAEPGTITITEAATAHGFSELGRIANESQQMFGETPPNTLAKTKFAKTTRPTKTQH